MPNQRAKNKIYLGGFVDKKFHARVVRLAKQAGMAENKFGFVARLLEEELSRSPRRSASKAAAR
jgi:hypothetical protein